jgi:hypothetical protein
MSTVKHRIAAYLPSDVDEKFQAFKQERGVGDSQALILILTEFLGVSQEMSHSNSLDIDALKSELLSELELRFSELKSELSSKPLVDSPDLLEQRLTVAQLSVRFGCDSALVRKQKSKYKDEPEKFIAWSKSRDPDGYGWKFDEVNRVFERTIPTKPIPSP